MRFHPGEELEQSIRRRGVVCLDGEDEAVFLEVRVGQNPLARTTWEWA
jgi:hypothetical protein